MFGFRKKQSSSSTLAPAPTPAPILQNNVPQLIPEPDIPKTDWSKIPPTHEGPRPSKEPARTMMPHTYKSFSCGNEVAFQRQLGRIYVRDRQGYTQKNKGELKYAPPMAYADTTSITKSGVVAKYNSGKSSFIYGELTLVGTKLSWRSDIQVNENMVIEQLFTHEYNKYLNVDKESFVPNALRIYYVGDKHRSDPDIFMFPTDGECIAWRWSILYNMDLDRMSNENKQLSIRDLSYCIRDDLSQKGIDWDWVFNELYTA